VRLHATTCLPSCLKTKPQLFRLLWGPQTSFSSCKTSNLPSTRNVLSDPSGMIMQVWRQNVTCGPALMDRLRTTELVCKVPVLESWDLPRDLTVPETLSVPWMWICLILGEWRSTRDMIKKFWEELVAYFPFPIIWVFNHKPKKKPSVCKRSEVNKTQFERLRFWYYWRGMDLWSTPLRWLQMAWCTYRVSWRLVQAFK
jgi:hypothetical protein